VRPAHGPGQQGTDDRLGGRVPDQLIRVALDRDGSAFVAHRATHRPGRDCGEDDFTAPRARRHAE
jgi:hypothetical protein